MTAEVAAPLSGWWMREHHRALAANPDLAVRLALALRAIQAAIRVVDNTVPPMSVEWTAAGEREGKSFSSSYTDMKGHRIALNPLPYTEGKLDYGHALDICTGFALHEAGHSQHSRGAFQMLIRREEITDPTFVHDDPATVYSRATGKPTREVPKFRPLRVAGWLLNLVEDVRSEGQTAKDWPGFADYFPLVKDYMWSGKKPASYGPDVASKMNLVYLACRYPERLVPGFLDATMEPEAAWWEAWQHDYLSGVTDVEATIAAGLAHLELDTETADEMKAMAAEERAAEEAGENLRRMIERLMEEGVEGAPMVCITDAGETVELDAATAERVDELVRENLVEVTSKIKPPPGSGISVPPIRVRKPEETPESRRAYVGRPDAAAQALRAALVFRASAAEHTIKLQERGELDDEELHRWGAGDYRVFSDRVIETRPDVFMGLLVDLSGSMAGSKLAIAQRLAQLWVWAMADQPGITTAVWGHTADRPSGVDILRLWETGDPLSRLGIITASSHANNGDGWALEYVARQVLEQREPQKIVVVLSDGQPSMNGYGGMPAMKHVRSVVEWSERQGCPVVQIAIDPYGLDETEQRIMFRHVVAFRDEATLPRQLAAIMARLTT